MLTLCKRATARIGSQSLPCDLPRHKKILSGRAIQTVAGAMGLIDGRRQLCGQAIKTGTEAWQNGVARLEQAMDVATLNTCCDVCTMPLGILKVDEQALGIIRVDLCRQGGRLRAFHQGPATPRRTVTWPESVVKEVILTFSRAASGARPADHAGCWRGSWDPPPAAGSAH